MTSREQFIQQLRDDNRGGVDVYSLGKTTLLWNVFAWLLVISATLWVQALRPGWFAQFINYPHFALETVSGFVAVVLLSLLVFRMGIPASRRRWLLLGVVVSSGIWLLSLTVGLFDPALEPSMAGKRAHCRYEVFVYAIGPFLLGMYYLHRACVLSWPLGALCVGAASVMIPAWIMQFACIYDPAHILINHIAPVVVVAILAGVIGLILEGKFTK